MSPLMQMIIENAINEQDDEFVHNNFCSKGHFVVSSFKNIYVYLKEIIRDYIQKLPGCDLHCYIIKDKSQVKGVMVKI